MNVVSQHPHHNKNGQFVNFCYEYIEACVYEIKALFVAMSPMNRVFVEL